jgi:hypothetical protein
LATQEGHSEDHRLRAPIHVSAARACAQSRRDSEQRCSGAIRSAAPDGVLSGCHHHPGHPVQPSNSVLLGATWPPSRPDFHCLSCVPEVETRGALLPLVAAAASLLPASRRVPGPVAGLIAHILLLPAATCGLPTPFSTSFPAHRSRSVLGEVALVLFGVVVGAWALSSLAWRLSWYGGLNENAQPFQGYLWYNCTSPDLVTVVPDTPWIAWEGRVGRCGLPVLERTR